jgi:hypothetical protein
MSKPYYSIGATPHNLDGPLSKSMLWRFNESPYRWKYGYDEDSSPTPAMRLGTLIHALCFDENDYVVSPYPDFRTKESREWRDEQEKLGFTVVSEKEMITAQGASDAFNRSPLVPNWFNTEVEVHAELCGSPCKGMIDMVPHEGNRLYDLKTTASIKSLRNLESLIIDRGYHWQAAMYLDLYNSAYGTERNEFSIIFMETSLPYEIAVVTLDAAFIELGRCGYESAIKRFQRCVESNTWPGIVPTEVKISPPKWAFENKNN